jgi:YidC/Oxa1 family membrane protein insertase
MLSTIGYYICIPFAALTRLFYTLTGSYGVSLILFTIVVKLILLPFQMKSKKSMVRMNRMNGKVQEIQKKYANNQAKMGEEMQKLYQEEGASPMSGCLWSFIPMPILIALYYIIREPITFFMNFGGLESGRKVLEGAKAVMTQIGLTWTQSANGADGPYAQIEIVKQLAANADKAPVKSFFAANPNWINVDYNFLGLDLGTNPSDAISMMKTGVTWAAIGLLLIPIVSAVLQLLVMKITTKGQPTTGAAASSNKMMLFTMPLISLWIGYTLPAALGVYWIAQSAFSAIQEAILGKFYNQKIEQEEDEHQKQVEENRRKRQEEARLRQEQQRQISAKEQAAARKKAAKAAQEAGKGKKASTTENGRIGDRPYARGRAYRDEHYQETSDKDQK